jgi:dihydroorotate dehydrogenase
MGTLPANCAVRSLGLDFPGPVGLAAGFDRDGRHLRDILGWGFGFVELGTVTPQAEPDHNPGAAALAANLVRSGLLDRGIGARPVIGVSLGLQPASPPQCAWRDYLYGMHVLWRHADYLVLNFSSTTARPLHTAGQRSTLLALLAHAQEERQRLVVATGRRVPLLVKWLVGAAFDDAAEMAQRLRGFGYDGLIAAFDQGLAETVAWEAWVPRACRQIAEAIGAQMTLIVVGGIDCARRAVAVQRAGASLVQIYRGFLTAGPPLVREVAGAWAGQTAAARAAAVV